MVLLELTIGRPIGIHSTPIDVTIINISSIIKVKSSCRCRILSLGWNAGKSFGAAVEGTSDAIKAAPSSSLKNVAL
jgi:hypothetical protein